MTDNAKELLARLDRWIEHFGKPTGNGRANPDNDMIYLLSDCRDALCLSARQQASVEEVARMLCNADGHDPDSVETFGIRTIRHGRRTDTGHDDRHGHREDCASWPLWHGYEPIARALLAKYDIFEKVEG
jgi:hypothetical protein